MRALRLTRDELVAEARSWIDTPFLWQASVKGRGCDCRGLVLGVARELDLPEAKDLLTQRANYRRNFAGEIMLAGLEQALIRTRNPAPGDVVTFRVGTTPGPRHLAILTPDRRMVHCYGAGPMRVVEVPIGRSRPIHSYWTWPSLGGTDGH